MGQCSYCAGVSGTESTSAHWLVNQIYEVTLPGHMVSVLRAGYTAK